MWERTLQLLQKISLSVIFQESIRNQLLELEMVHEIIRLNTNLGDFTSLSLTHFHLNLFLYRSVILVTLVISVTPITHLFFHFSFVGPMLLFERFYKDGQSPRRFYACSASRDRKDCSFFQWEEEKISEARKKAHQEIIKTSRLPFIEACHKYQSIFESLDNLQRKKCLFCHSCGQLFMPIEKGRHCTHEFEQAGDLRKPTMIMRPRENEKTQAVSSMVFLHCIYSSISSQCLVYPYLLYCYSFILHYLSSSMLCYA